MASNQISALDVRRSRRRGAPALLLALAGTPALAGAVQWINPAGGLYAEPTNWDSGMIPLATDSVTFNVPGDFTVVLDAARTNNVLTLRDGTVSIDGLFGDYTLTSLSRAVRIGTGITELAHLRVIEGSVIADDVVAGTSTGSNGAITVTGASSVLDVADNLDMAENGVGSLTVELGGRVECERARFAFGFNGESDVNITGPDATMVATDRIQVGSELGVATASVFNLLDDATIDTPLFDIRTDGLVLLEGTVTGDVVNRGLIVSRLPVGEANTGGDLDLRAGSEIRVNIGNDKATLYTAAGVLHRAGELRVNKLAELDIALGQKWVLFRASSFSGQFDTLTLPTTTPNVTLSLFQIGNAITLFASTSAGPADVTLDGVVNAGDLAVLLSAWDSDLGSVDFDANGVVNAADLAFLLSSWTTS